MSEKQSPPSLKYFLSFLRPYLGLVFVSLLFLIAGRITASLEPVWLKKIIDGVTQGKTLAALLSIVIFYFGLRAVGAIFDFLKDLIFSPAEMGISRTLSVGLFNRLLELPIGYHVEQKLGSTSRRISRGSQSTAFILDFMIDNILPTVIQLVIVTVFLLKLYRPIYGITTFLTIVIYTVYTIWATELRQKYRIAVNKSDDEVSALEVDSISNIETVKYFNSEDELRRRYKPLVDYRYKVSVISNQLFSLVSGGQSLILLIGLGIILVVAIRQTVSHQLTVGDLVLLTSYIAQLSAPIGVLGFIYRRIKDGLTDITGMLNIMQEEVTIVEPSDPTPIPQPKGEVTFTDVSFGYSGKRQVLSNVSFTIQPGQRVAFVGSSGAGKSTIVKLLFRLFDPTNGDIQIDGVDLRQLSKETRRNITALVPQEPILFNTSIADNIRFAKPDATDEEIAAACRLASISTLIESLPDKYDTLVGERGVKLSGGEKQRVAIARSIIRNPKILVFDEATSSLDSTSERAILQALERVSEGRTTIAVAHRLSTIANSDTIFVLDKGEIIESGSHTELLKKNGRYATLWNLQAGGHDPEESEEN